MTTDEVGFLTRPDLPPGFERWELLLPAGERRPTTAGEWAGALVRVENGTLEVRCLAGGQEVFHTGDLLALGWLPIVELRNAGHDEVRLLAVRRRGSTPRDAYLHVHRAPNQGRSAGFLSGTVRFGAHTARMNDEATTVPPRLAPFLAQWDYFSGVLFDRLEGLTDEEFLWEPADDVLTVRMVDGRPQPDALGMEPSGAVAPPRTIAWSVGHLGAGAWERADYLVGDHRLQPGELTWPMTAGDGVAFLREGLDRWRNGLATMTDADLDTVGRSAYPWGLDPELLLIEIVWWVNKELIYHASEIWLLRDLYHARVA